MPTSLLARAAALLAFAAASATAQRPTPIPPPPADETPAVTAEPQCQGVSNPGCPPPRVLFGIAGAIAQPVGEFRDHADVAAGMNFNVVLMLAPNSPVGLLVQGGFISYGTDEQDVRIGLPFGGTIPAELGTSYTYAGVAAGPEIARRTGSVRPYIGGTVGYGNFSARSSLSVRDRDPEEGESDRDELWSRTHASDGVLTLTGLGGLRIALGSARSAFAIDVGARYVRNGEAQYVERGNIVENADGSTTVTMTRSRADFVAYTLGLSIGFGASR